MNDAQITEAAKPRILIVEDDTIAAIIAKRIFEGLGYQVELAKELHVGTAIPQTTLAKCRASGRPTPRPVLRFTQKNIHNF